LDADRNQLTADNASIGPMWDQLYLAINRANVVISKVPGVPDLSQAEKNDLRGQAFFLRALHYHNLVKFWGGVPLRLEPVSDPVEAAKIARSSVDEVYAQIIKDLDSAKALMPVSETTPTRATRGAVEALRSRVLLFRQDWAGVVKAANDVEALGYSLAPRFADLFASPGTRTPEDIFKIIYTPDERQELGWYYRSKTVTSNGRYEVAPTCKLMSLFDPNVNCTASNPYATFAPVGQRAQVSVAVAGSDPYGSKWPTGSGDEDFDVIRFAEVILNRAEAEAQLNQLTQAVADLNRIRTRAGTTLFVLGTQTKQQVLDAIYNERRLELAFEGFRWPDLVRTGQALTALNLPQSRAYQLLFPIPQEETDVAPNVAQNPGY
jgi:hypothetical protein